MSTWVVVGIGFFHLINGLLSANVESCVET
jgi:hypothetical protein